MKAKLNPKKQKKIERYLNIVIGMMILMPIICCLYLMLKANVMVTDIKALLETYPEVTVLFLTAMIHPYIAYLLILEKKKLKENNFTSILANMGLIMIAEGLLNNIVYVVFLSIIFYLILKESRISIKQVVQSLFVKRSFIQYGGSLLVIMTSSLCLFATIRLM